MPVIILQHPKESQHPFNTARILQLCLTHCVTLLGEQFQQQAVEQLYPEHQLALVFPKSEPESSVPTDSQKSALVLIDASWRKAKRIYFENPWLQALPCVAIEPKAASQYQIRRANNETYLSTLESCVEALEIVDVGCDSKQLMQPFRAMVGLQKQVAISCNEEENKPA